MQSKPKNPFRKAWGLVAMMVVTGLLVACSSRVRESELAQMRYLSAPSAYLYPDYADCTIPVNIAPLNFYILSPHSRYELQAYGSGSDTLRLKGRHRVRFALKTWHRLLAQNLHDTLRVQLSLQTREGVQQHAFTWAVQDSIDPYFSCRLIEPSYQTSSVLQTIEYNLQDATTRFLFDNRLQGIGCENCHTYAQSNGDYIVYHVRFDHTGTFIITPEQTLRVDLKSQRFPQGGVYPTWHPNKELIAFGTASAYPFVHAQDIVRRTEVYDSFGDIMLYDVLRNYIFTDERLCDSLNEETFPYWSPDGQWLYVCQSPNPPRDAEEDDVDFSKKIRYNLIRVAFNDSTRTFGRIDTVINAAVAGYTVSFPRLSPDGHFLAVCLSDHGTFPIRHPESDLYLLNLSDSEGESFERKPGFLYPVKKMEHVNSPYTESYHTFSSKGSWLMYSTKREDNLYSRPYFTYIDSMGFSHKPFLLPQQDPAMYLSFFRSFNVPEFSNRPIRTSAAEAKRFSRMERIRPDSIVILKYPR